MSVAAPIPELRTEETPPPWRDVRVVRWVLQIATVLVVVWFFSWLFGNLTENLESRGLPTGYGFLDGKFGSAIPGLDDAADYTGGQAFLAGFWNTVRVIAFGIPGCTVIGILIGVARLSDNLMVRAFGTAYVELFRNVPALVWIFIAHFAIAVGSIPAITEAPAGYGFVLSNRSIGIPWLNPEASRWGFVGYVLLSMFAVWLVLKWRGRVNARTGQPSRGGLYGTIVFLVGLVVAHVASGGALQLDGSMLNENGRNIVGGMSVQIPYFSLTVALTLYTASHVAEVVRGAILAIHKGQTEAANAIALTTFQRYRYIILPQAFRIMIPPLANQYLNITKNSSLAVAVGYIEIAAIFNRLANNAAPAVSVIVILMLMYLAFSLTISLFANTMNARLSLDPKIDGERTTVNNVALGGLLLASMRVGYVTLDGGESATTDPLVLALVGVSIAAAAYRTYQIMNVRKARA